MLITNTHLYGKVVKITQKYLGPAAERFIQRQVRAHLNKEPEDLTSTDLKNLTEWLKIAMALLTEDTKLVDEYIISLKKLTKAK